MKRKSTIIGALIVTGMVLAMACGNENSEKDQTAQKTETPQETPATDAEVHGTLVKEEDVKLSTPLDQKMVATGKGLYEVKCAACHKLSDEKLVGPGWKNVTKRRSPAWIMNMITNVDTMLETDPEAQKLLEQCLVRMPNQNLSGDEARSVLEMMRSNDGVK